MVTLSTVLLCLLFVAISTMPWSRYRHGIGMVSTCGVDIGMISTCGVETCMVSTMPWYRPVVLISTCGLDLALVLPWYRDL
jgi:hypothetical protein